MYKIVLSTETLQALDEYVHHIAIEKEAPHTAAKWLKKALATVSTLQTFPHRCPAAPESDFSEFEIRMLAVDSCMFIYRVDEDAKLVRVQGFRHGRQRPLLGL